MAESKITGIDHIAIAVRSLKEALPFYTDTLGLCVTHEEVIKQEGIRVAFVDAGGVMLELMEPLDDKSFVARHIKKRGQGLAHICFATDNLDGLIDGLREKEMTLLSEGPIAGAGERRVVFLHPKDNSGTLTEFAEQPEYE